MVTEYIQGSLTGRLRGLIDALRVTSECMRTLPQGPAYEALKVVYRQIEAKYEEVEATRATMQS